MADKQRILIVDDDESIADVINLFLSKESYATEIAYDGEEALLKFGEFKPDLILLDIMLPGIGGHDVLREIRKTSHVPVILVSAKGEVFDRVLGLELGADDYIMKPFDPKEMVARVRAVLRRFAYGMQETGDTGAKTTENTISGSPNADTGEFISYEGLLINKSNYTVIYNNKKLDVAPKELELLYYLASNPNRVFTREQLLKNIWNYDYVYEVDSRTVDVHVKRLREKIKNQANWKISTVWGVGYKFEVD